jgi:cytochrome c oxidase subunit 2
VGKFWSLIFLLVPVLGVGLFVVAPFFGDLTGGRLADHWLPVDVSTDGYRIDHLFMFILWLTGVVFIATECALFYFMWRYNNQSNAAPAKFTHGSHTLEVVWTILPAVTLLFIAIYQINAWADAKMMLPAGPDGRPVAALAEITGRQFEWRIRYPGPDGVMFTRDDLHDVNDLHIPVDQDIVLVIKAEDVLHSFFLPHFRVKQDVVPGMKQHVHFRARPGTDGQSYDLVCAELCGWGHYKMKGRITIDSPSDFQRHLDGLQAEQERTTEKPPVKVLSNE